MKARLQAFIFATVMTLPLLVFAQEGTPAIKSTLDEPTKAKVEPNALPLSMDDQKQLDLINDRLGQMKPQLEQAQKQRDDAQARLNEANAFIAQYNAVESIKAAFLFRIAADVCGCKTSDLEWSSDGKRVLRKGKDPKKIGATERPSAGFGTGLLRLSR